MGILAEQFKNQREAHVPQGIVSVTPSDTVKLVKPIRAFMVTVAGNVSVLMADGSSGIYSGCVPGGQYMGKICRAPDDTRHNAFRNQIQSEASIGSVAKKRFGLWPAENDCL